MDLQPALDFAHEYITLSYNSMCIFSVCWQYTAQYKDKKKAFVVYNKLRI